MEKNFFLDNAAQFLTGILPLGNTPIFLRQYFAKERRSGGRIVLELLLPRGMLHSALQMGAKSSSDFFKISKAKLEKKIGVFMLLEMTF